MSQPTPTPAHPDEQRVRVALGPRSYEINVVSGHADRFGPFVRKALESTWAGRGTTQAVFITDPHVQPLLPRFSESLASVGYKSSSFVVPAGEATKNLEQATLLFDRLVSQGADRHTAIVALGGGVIGDLAGFVAASFARGLPLVMVPTTLLSQVDSSVGGKVGVNHPQAKNLIGAFHQPVCVWIDTETLDTLPPRDFRCGLAEVIKYGVILDAEFFHQLEHDAVALHDHEAATIRRVVARCCRLKADVVSKDEREETGLRAVLNFGHTVAHAIEAVAGYEGNWPHGEAVAVGMVAEARLAERLGWIEPPVTQQITHLIERLGLPTHAPGLAVPSLLEAMTRDKKNRAGRVRFVLPRSIGKVELTDLPTTDDIAAVLEPLVESSD